MLILYKHLLLLNETTNGLQVDFKVSQSTQSNKYLVNVYLLQSHVASITGKMQCKSWSLSSRSLKSHWNNTYEYKKQKRQHKYKTRDKLMDLVVKETIKNI